VTGQGTVAVRPERPGDVAHTQDVVAAAFGDAVVPALLADLRRCDGWRGLSFVAEVSGEVVGHVSYTRGWLDAPVRLLEVLVLSPLSVTPTHQRKGVGSQLVRRSLAMLRDRPEPLVFLEGSPGYYARFGFRPGAAGGFAAPSDRIPDAAFQFIPLARHHSSMTGRLVYPDVFWRHDAVGLRI
jgi:putative acetyltransferase